MNGQTGTVTITAGQRTVNQDAPANPGSGTLLKYAGTGSVVPTAVRRIYCVGCSPD